MVTPNLAQAAPLDTLEGLGLDPGIESESTEEGPPAPVVDYAKALAEAKAQIAKLQVDLKAQKPRPQRQSQRDADLLARIDGLASEITALRKGQAVVAKGVVSGETEGLEQQLNQVDSDHAQSQAQRVREAAYQQIVAQTNEALQDDNGDFVLGFTDPIFKDAVEEWNEAAQDGDLRGIRRAAREIRRLAKQAQAEIGSKNGAGPKATATAASLEDHNLDTGPGIGGTGSSDEQFMREYGDISGNSRRNTQADHARARKILAKG